MVQQAINDGLIRGGKGQMLSFMLDCLVVATEFDQCFPEALGLAFDCLQECLHAQYLQAQGTRLRGGLLLLKSSSFVKRPIHSTNADQQHDKILQIRQRYLSIR